MKSNTLFRWALKKFSLPVLLIILVIGWRHSSSLYRYEVSSIESELRNQVLNSTAISLDSKSHNDLSITVMNSKGAVVFDNVFGSHEGGAPSASLKRALAGESFIIHEKSPKSDLVFLWSP